MKLYWKAACKRRAILTGNACLWASLRDHLTQASLDDAAR